MALEQRIVRYGAEDPRALHVHPLNFRRHPNQQHEVVGGSLEELGWIDDVLVNLRTSDEWSADERNVLTVINGHLRRDIAIAKGEATVPCKFVDLSPDEERLALAVFDESTALAQRDTETLGELLSQLNPNNESLAEFLDGLMATEAAIEDDAESPEEFNEFDEDLATDYRCPKCGYEWSGSAV